MKGVWVTGTGTGVGKTLVTSTLLAWARARGAALLPFKPVQTGWPADDDVATALQAAGLHIEPRIRKRLSPHCYRLAASPHLAARGRVTVDRIVRAAQALDPLALPLIVEGAGGVLVPLNARETLRDAMVALPLPVLLVARAGLGTLNHTLLSLEALRAAGCTVAGIVLNQQPDEPWGRIEADNLRTLRDRTDLPVVRFRPVAVPRVGKTLAVNFQSLEKIPAVRSLCGDG